MTTAFSPKMASFVLVIVARWRLGLIKVATSWIFSTTNLMTKGKRRKAQYYTTFVNTPVVAAQPIWRKKRITDPETSS